MQSNLTLYSVLAFVILDTDGNRVLAKYYKPKHQPQQFADVKALPGIKEQRSFEKSLWEKTKKPGGDIILYDSLLAVYKHSLDLIFYIIGPPTENELMLHGALAAYADALSLLLRNQLEKRAVLDNLDLSLLCLDETIDDGSVPPLHPPSPLTMLSIILETDATAIASRVSRPRADTTDIVINEQSIMNAYQTVKERVAQRISQM